MYHYITQKAAKLVPYKGGKMGYLCLCTPACLCLHPHVGVYTAGCFCVCLHVCVCAHLHVRLHLHVCVRAHLHVCVCTCMFVCILTFVCAHPCLCVCTCTRFPALFFNRPRSKVTSKGKHTQGCSSSAPMSPWDSPTHGVTCPMSHSRACVKTTWEHHLCSSVNTSVLGQ